MTKTNHFRLSRGALALLALLAAGCVRAPSTEKPKSAPRVTVAHPTVRELVDEDDYNGWLAAYKTVEVRARVRGHIQSIHFTDGDIVRKGQLLFELDPRPFQVEINQAQANAKALEAQKVAAKKDLARYTELIKSGAASRQQLEKAQADADAYDAMIAAKLEEVKRYELDLQYSKITADIGGKISKANLTEGNLVNAGGSDPLLTTIVAIDPIYVDFDVDERAMQRYQATDTGSDKDRQQSLRERNLPFYFGLDTEKGFPHEGRLVFADNQYTEGTGTIPVRGEAKNTDGRLIPKSHVRVRVPVSDKYRATLVPDTAISTDQDKKFLLVVEGDNIAKRRDVSLGRLLDDGMRVIQTPELKSDEWIIVEGMELARLNCPVEPVPESAPTATPDGK